MRFSQIIDINQLSTSDKSKTVLKNLIFLAFAYFWHKPNVGVILDIFAEFVFFIKSCIEICFKISSKLKINCKITWIKHAWHGSVRLLAPSVVVWALLSGAIWWWFTITRRAFMTRTQRSDDRWHRYRSPWENRSNRTRLLPSKKAVPHTVSQTANRDKNRLPGKNRARAN